MIGKSAFPISPRAWLACGYILLLLIGGGGGSPAPLAELFCKGLAAITVCLWLWLDGPAAIRGTPAPLWVAGLILLVPLAQLVPLPPSLWHGLPGRDLLRENLALVGADRTWRPLSIAPQRTLDGVLALFPPLLAMLLTASLNGPGRQAMLKTIAMFSLVSVCIGAGQMSLAGNGALHFYAGSDPGVPAGFQANRNAQVDILLIGLLALVAAWHRQASEDRAAMIALIAAVLLLLLGAFLTGSRTGIALSPLVLGWCLVLMRRDRLPASPLFRPRNLAVAAVMALGLAIAAWPSRAIQVVWQRFSLTGEYRPEIWRDTLFAIAQYWPFGSGLGTFTRAIGPAERLEMLGPLLPNRAHSEYLELLLEGGLPIALAWAAAALLLIAALLRAQGVTTGPPRDQAVFAGGTTSVIALHALVDYPFRSIALAALAAVAAALVLSPPKMENPPL